MHIVYIYAYSRYCATKSSLSIVTVPCPTPMV